MPRTGGGQAFSYCSLRERFCELWLIITYLCPVLTCFKRYVAMHTIQDIAPSSSPSHSHSNGYGDSRDTPKAKGSIQDLAVSVVGMILPLFLQIGHAH